MFKGCERVKEHYISRPQSFKIQTFWCNRFFIIIFYTEGKDGNRHVANSSFITAMECKVITKMPL